MRTTEVYINDRTYNLRLTIENTIKLQKKLNKNPLEIFTEVGANTTPPVEELATILYYALQPSHADEFKNIPSVYELIDNYFDQDNDITDLIKLILEIYKASGIIPKNVKTEK